MGGGSGSGSDGDASGTPLAAAAAAATAGSGSGMKSGEADHGADDATGSQTKGGDDQRPLVHRSSRALSVEAAAFHPRPQQFVAPPAPPPLWFGPQHFAFDPAAPQHFALDPAAHHQQFAAQFAFDPAAAMGRGSAGYNYNLNLNLNLPATRPENQRFTGSAFPSTHWPVRTPAAASASSASGPPPAPGPSSPGLGRERPPADPAHSIVAARTQQAARVVDNLRLPPRRTAYVPPTSLSLGPRSQSTSSGSSSSAATPKLTYAALTRHGLATSEEMDKWKSKMLNYLKRGDGQASMARIQLEVQFHDILMKDKELAVQLCNAQGSNEFWLRQAANEFFTESGVSTTGPVSFHFKDMPIRLAQADVVLKSSALSKCISVCDKAKTIEVATVHGRQTLDTIICGLLDSLVLGDSWQGDIAIEDLILAEYSTGRKLIITKEPVVKGNASVDDRLDDLWAIWYAVQPFYLVGDRLPLYFGRLQIDLLDATHLQDWFLDYLRYHPAFYASNPRKNLICGIQLACQSKTKLEPSLCILFTLPPFDEDWRISTTNEVLHSISSYKKEKERKEKEKKERKEDLEQKLKGGKVDDISDAEQYVDTLLSLIAFQRNGLQHPYDHAMMFDKDEMELLLAATFEDFLPNLIRGLLSMCNMDGQFASDWSTYRASKSDDKEPPFVGGPDSKEGH